MEYYVLHKKSGCHMYLEERLGNINPRHCQKTDFLAHSLNPLICQVKTLKLGIYFVRGFQDCSHQKLLLVEVKMISDVHDRDHFLTRLQGIINNSLAN